jgi:hypothetical protein
MRTTDGAANAVSNLASHPLRSSLTMLGMIFGVGAVIAMLSIGEGAERQALEMIERLGIRNILVRDLDLERDELEEARSKSLGVSPARRRGHRRRRRWRQRHLPPSHVGPVHGPGRRRDHQGHRPTGWTPTSPT